MKKKKAFALYFCLIACFSFSIFNANASISTQKIILSQGTVINDQSQNLFGNMNIGTNLAQNDANAQSISYFLCTSTGSVTDIMAYICGASPGKAIAALYATSGNSAGSLLEQSSSVNIGTSFSWVDFKLSTPSNVNSGLTYGLAIMGDVSIRLMEVTASGQRDHNALGSYANGFTNPFGTIWGTDYVGAMCIYAIGTSTQTPAPISTPTPIPTITPSPTSTPAPTPQPTSTPTSTNLEPFSVFCGDVGGAASSYASVDYGVTHNGNPSIRTGPDYVRSTREVDGAWISVKPGDHIVFSAWVKTAAYQSSDLQGGSVIGFDFCAQTNLGYGIIGPTSTMQAGHPDGAERAFGSPTNIGHTINGENGMTQVGGLICKIPWGTDWTLLSYDFYVPTTSYTWVWGTSGGGSLPGQPAQCNPVQINSMVTWFETRSVTDNAYSWFAEPQLYINP